MSGKGVGRREDFLKDLHDGMVDRELMKKYKLTPRGLGTLFRNLVNAEVISFRELIKMASGQLNLPEMIAELRIRSRKQVEFLLPVSDLEEPENVGLVYDISDDGVGTRGLKASVHEIMTLVIPADDYFHVEPVIFKGVCRWVEEKEDRWESAAGFRVEELLRGSLTGLQDIIRVLRPGTNGM
jgi:hypothetical protein